MPDVLYRKYRPQKFSQVTGQTHIRSTIQSQIEQGKTAHAYLFCGPRGVSKTTIARIVAKAVNCENRGAKESEPCDACSSCQDILASKSMDVIEIDAASHTGVDNVRENIIENSRFHPTRSKNKVYIIDEVHMLSTSAFNALLKTLEEPPSYAMFILVTTEAHKIPSTIISRCQRFDFHRIAVTDMVEAMEKIVISEDREVEKNVLESVARYADGCLRDALSLLDQVLSFGERHISLDQVRLILPPSYFESVVQITDCFVRRDALHSLNLVSDLVQNGADISHFVDEIVEFYRKLLIAKISESTQLFAFEVTSETLTLISQLLTVLDSERIVATLNILLRRRQEMSRSSILQLPLEIACVEICALVTTVSGGVSRPVATGASQPMTNTVQNVPLPQKTPSVTQTAPVDLPTPTSTSTPAPSAVEKNLVSSATSQDRVSSSETQVSSSDALPVGDVSVQEVYSVWQKLISALSEHAHSLALILQVGKPISTQGNTVVIGFQFKLHQQRIADMKNRPIIEDTLSQLLGKKVVVQAEVSDLATISVVPLEEMVSAEIGGVPSDVAYVAVSSPEDADVSAILKEFGGEVVG